MIIVGAGPAGLNAALLLARARRSVLLCDEGGQRNRYSQALHGFLTRDGINPNEFLKLAKEGVLKYDTVTFQQSRVVHADAIEGGFRVKFATGCSDRTCKKLLLATGVIDELPALPNIEPYFGKSVFHCPYCDGFEFGDKKLAAFSNGECGRELALELLGWSENITLVTNGAHGLEDSQVDQLTKCGITIIDQPIARLEGKDGYLQALHFTDGRREPCDAMFFGTERYQKSLLAESLGCAITAKGLYDTHKFESTNIPGMFVAGDASSALHLVTVAAASGCEAAFAINTQLLKEQIRAKLLDI